MESVPGILCNRDFMLGRSDHMKSYLTLVVIYTFYFPLVNIWLLKILADFLAGFTAQISNLWNYDNVRANSSLHMESYFYNMESMFEIPTNCR
jgi:hypothetical protein